MKLFGGKWDRITALITCITRRKKELLMVEKMGLEPTTPTLPEKSVVNGIPLIFCVGGMCSRWRREVGYHERSIVENIFSRWRTIFVENISSKNEESQQVEVTIKSGIQEPGAINKQSQKPLHFVSYLSGFEK